MTAPPADPAFGASPADDEDPTLARIREESERNDALAAERTAPRPVYAEPTDNVSPVYMRPAPPADPAFAPKEGT
jgi:hypothetical protein